MMNTLLGDKVEASNWLHNDQCHLDIEMWTETGSTAYRRGTGAELRNEPTLKSGKKKTGDGFRWQVGNIWRIGPWNKHLAAWGISLRRAAGRVVHIDGGFERIVKGVNRSANSKMILEVSIY